jgi:putative alpha-1,2-mannosidase
VGLRLGQPGRAFTIEAIGNCERNVYVQSAELDGRPLGVPRLPDDRLARAGRLVLRMGPEPAPARWAPPRR